MPEPTPTDEQYLARVSAYDGGMYGGIVGDLTGGEKWTALEMRDRGLPARDAAHKILRDRGLMPPEPHPRAPSGNAYSSTTALPASDRAGRIGRVRSWWKR